MRAVRWLLLLLAATLDACSSPAPIQLADGEIWGYDRPSVADAVAGSSITWRCEGGHIADATHACVAAGPDGVVIEERETWPQAVMVTALRYTRDGKLLAAWRGRAGSRGVPLRIVPPPTDRDLRAVTEAHGESLDAATAGAKIADATETLATPAGRFTCKVRRVETSFLDVAMKIASWYAEERLPLSQLVQYEITSADTGTRRQVLVAYATTGAVPLLTAPRAP